MNRNHSPCTASIKMKQSRGILRAGRGAADKGGRLANYRLGLAAAASHVGTQTRAARGQRAAASRRGRAPLAAAAAAATHGRVAIQTIYCRVCGMRSASAATGAAAVRGSAATAAEAVSSAADATRSNVGVGVLCDVEGEMSTFRHPQSTPSRNQTDFTMKAPKPPDRPLVPYMRYSRKMWSKVRAENPDAQLWDIGKIIGQMWRDISDADKAVYQHEYEIEKVEYEKAFKAYQNSHAYQQYVTAKTRAKANEKSSRSRMEVGGVVIQPVDEEDAGNELSCRRLAAVRFDRNHRLIGDLFSPTVVTDTRTVVAQNRMDMLRKQAQSLSAHQNKLEEELVKLEEIHQDKKRQIERGSEEFAENLKRVCEEKPQLDEEKYNELLEEMKVKLAEAYKEYKRKQDEINARLAAEREKIVEETPVLAELVMSDETDTDTVTKAPEKEAEEEAPKEEEKAEEKKEELEEAKPPENTEEAK